KFIEESSIIKKQRQEDYNPFDNHLAPSVEDEAIEKEIESKIKSAIFKANNISSYGNLPRSLSRYISSILEPRISWRQYLINKIVYAKHGGHIVKRLQRKTIYSPYKFFRTKESILDVVITVDTSGSIGEDDLNAFITEIKSIAETFKVKGKLLDCDTKINNVYDLEKLDNDLVNINFMGGGGTSFVPPFKFVEENNIKPKVFIYFTDAYGDFPEDAPPYEVIWLVKNSEVVPPFGEVIYYDKYND
ncbi:MAG: VWA-like domain-containing protein, partial [archaeon]